MTINAADAVYLGGTLVDAVYMGDVKVWPSGMSGIEKPTLEWVFNDGTTQGWQVVNIATMTETPDSLALVRAGYSLIDPEVGPDYIYTDGGASQYIANDPSLTGPTPSAANFIFRASGFSVPAGTYHLVLDVARDEDTAHSSAPWTGQTSTDTLMGFMGASFGPVDDAEKLAANLSYILGTIVTSLHSTMPVLVPMEIDPDSMPTPEQPSADLLLAYTLAASIDPDLVPETAYRLGFTLDSYEFLDALVGVDPGTAPAHNLAAFSPEELDAVRRWTSVGIEHPGGPIDLTIVVFLGGLWPWKLFKIALTDDTHTPAPVTGKMTLRDPDPLVLARGFFTFMDALKSSLPAPIPETPPPPLVFPTPSLAVEWTFQTSIEGATGTSGLVLPRVPTWESDGSDGWLSQSSPGAVKVSKDVYLEPGSYRTTVQFAMGAGYYEDPAIWRWNVATTMKMVAEGWPSSSKAARWSSAPGYGVVLPLDAGMGHSTGWMTMTTDIPLVITDRMAGPLSISVELYRGSPTLLSPGDFRVSKISLIDASGNVVRT